MERDRGTVIVLAGVALLVVTLAVSAALAPPREVNGDGTTETLVSVQGFRVPGNVQAYNGSETQWRLTGVDSYFEVERLPDGNLAVAFIEKEEEACGQFESPCHRTGFRVVEPGPDGQVVSEWTFPVRTRKASEVHAVEPLPGGGFAIADMEHERIAIVENDRVTWQWNASSFYEAPPDPTRVDWLHINDINRVGDGRFLVSVRNANQLLIVERGEGVVEVINEDRGVGSENTCRKGGELEDYDGDGEVRCGNPDLIHRQHNPHWLGDGAVLVADSDNDRVVELHRTDEGWKPVWTLDSAGDIAFDWPRDADRLPNGNTLVTDTLKERVVEVNESGTVVWSTSTEHVPYEADRVPYGERTGVPTFGEGGTDGQAGAAGDVPILSLLVLALHTGLPATPYWVGELQVFFMLVSLGLVGAGLVVRYRR